MAYTREWHNHKYIRKEGNRYIYPEDLKKSSTVRSNFRGSDQEFAKRQGAYSIQQMRREKAIQRSPGNVTYKGKTMTPSEYRSAVASSPKKLSASKISVSTPSGTTTTTEVKTDKEDKKKTTKTTKSTSSGRSSSGSRSSGSSSQSTSSTGSSASSSKSSSSSGGGHGQITYRAEVAKPLHIRNRGGAVRGSAPGRQHQTYSISQIAEASRMKEAQDAKTSSSSPTEEDRQESAREAAASGIKVVKSLNKAMKALKFKSSAKAAQKGAKVISGIFKKIK